MGSADVMPPRVLACVQLLERTGAVSFSLRYQDDEQPVVWIAQVEYSRDGRPVFEVDAGWSPSSAVERLAERLIDGGMCTHCRRPTGLQLEFDERSPAAKLICWYVYDPELSTFRRSCEGDD